MDPVTKGAAAWLAPHAKMRAETWTLLAVLLERPPGGDLLAVLGRLSWPEGVSDRMEGALRDIRRAGRGHTPAAAAGEFSRLFEAAGCGEMTPCASWYREGKLQSRALAALRSDLMRLGIVRREDHHEGEDHAAPLCEVMAMISRPPDELPLPEQADFFGRHLGTWMGGFFTDLEAKGSGFYRAVGAFGRRFLECESEYLQCISPAVPLPEGGDKP